MEVWIQHLLTQSLEWALFAVAVVTFFESLALVGLVLPGTVMMASLGALIGSGKIGLYPAWGPDLSGACWETGFLFISAGVLKVRCIAGSICKSIGNCWIKPSMPSTNTVSRPF